MNERTDSGAGAGARLPRLLSVSEAAAWLGVSRATLYRLMESEGLPSMRLRHKRLFPEPALARWVEGRTSGGVR